MNPLRWRRATQQNVAAALAALMIIFALLIVRNVLVVSPLDRLSPTAIDGERTRYVGSWHFPRGGPFVLGFLAPFSAKLSIDGQQVASGSGQQLVRRVYAKSVVEVEFVAPAGSRLLWHPPGRRGPPEYVPASVLSPLAPEVATFSAWVGAAPLDGAIALAILITLLALIVFLSRALLASIGVARLVPTLAVFGLALVARLIDLDGAGPTWDEDVNWSAGKNYISNLLSLQFADELWLWNFEHPPVSKYIAGIGAHFADGYGPARALSAIMVAASAALLVPIGARLFSQRVGVLAGIIAALTPHLIAHGKIVGHEAPMLLFWALAFWLALRAHDDEPDTRTLVLRFGVLGLVLGLAVFSRFANALLAPAIGLVLLDGAPKDQRERTVVAGFVVIGTVAIALGFAIWPRLWSAPIEHLGQSWAKLSKPHSLEPYLGTTTNQPARHYFATYLLATAPMGVLFGALLCLGRFLKLREAGCRRALILLLLPLLIMLSPVRQDGVRYIMPSLLALSLLSAAGLEWACKWLPAGAAPRRVGAALFCGYLLFCCWRVHPYYLDYYGEQVGGPRVAATNNWFETAWWGEGLHAGIKYVNEHAEPGARVHKRCVEPSHLAWLRHDLWASEVSQFEQADWILVYQPLSGRCPVPDSAELVFEESVQGAPLVRLYRMPRR